MFTEGVPKNSGERFETSPQEMCHRAKGSDHTWLSCVQRRCSARSVKDKGRERVAISNKCEGTSSISWFCRILPTVCPELCRYRPATDKLATAYQNQEPANPKTQWKWQAEQEEAFKTLKSRLCTTPVLMYPDTTKPYDLHTDASSTGLGVVLYQKIEDKLHVVAYASRCLRKAEIRYPVHKREFSALKWAICEKFSDYLYGAPKFTVRKDNNPLTYVLSSAKLDATGHRWLASLSAYDFEIKYTPGKNNQDADALYRLQEKVIDIGSVQAVCSIDHAPYVLTMDIDEEDYEGIPTLPAISLTEFRQAQNTDPILSGWMTDPARNRIMSRNWDKLILQRGIMYVRS
ncbi:Pol polyprotein [Elysia marginata]|uniref:Pol polyprotein n=1 Tax=Elysia marginata TaxID=1093978 RepID=A0AAV4FIE0_9GAST|nr:Pol polyprotein [Elysia marginata]